MSRRRRAASIRSSTRRWATVSRSVVGSSAISRLGSFNRARASITRWSIPPLS